MPGHNESIADRLRHYVSVPQLNRLHEPERATVVEPDARNVGQAPGPPISCLGTDVSDTEETATGRCLARELPVGIDHHEAAEIEGEGTADAKSPSTEDGELHEVGSVWSRWREIRSANPQCDTLRAELKSGENADAGVHPLSTQWLS